MTEDEAYWSKKPARRIEKNEFVVKILHFLHEGTDVLDLGCGRGSDTLDLVRHGCRVTALDISAANVDHLRKASEELKNVTVLQHDLAQALPFGSESFDAVYAHLSLHYFDDEKTKEIFAEIARVLRSTGYLFVKCKSIHDPLYGRGEEVGKDMYLHEHVRHFFSLEYMRECVSGFKILSLEETRSTYLDYESAFIEAIAQKA